MTEEQAELGYDEDAAEYCEEDEYEGYDEDQEGDEAQDGIDIKVGDEIALTHEEVWDDTALIEAWDAAVKQYEVYHSKSRLEDSVPTSTASNKSKNKAAQVAASPSPEKRVKFSDGQGSQNVENATNDILESEKAEVPPSTKLEHAAANVKVHSGTEFSVTERKPSFRKADKVSFSHHKDQWQQPARKKAQAPTKQIPTKQKTKTGALTSKAAAAPVTPPVDAATIAYYQQLGYYYDPSYITTDQETETKNEEQEEDSNLEGESPVHTSAPSNVASASSVPKIQTKKTPAIPLPTATQHAAAHTNYPFHGYPAGYPTHIPARAAAASIADGGYGMTGMGVPPPTWMGPGAGMGPGPMPFGPGFAPGPGPRYPLGVGMVPPPAASRMGMDDEALSNLIMAWYFSGYYTGFYQGQRR
ncbi:hypothetical protein BGX28_008088 [Mortierella sp. GBA30]|nr:hypothetical protein BGX28_008088 [Mortierella sp. GBA30]